ncbi:MAG: DUF2358 domain-containing protein [Okeania sp. SIO3C4]|nr:DUF2358 domain-containing protein [Okeania sp. SIO3B3]NER05763.1 DUF2358 domain-containing protein [Okeania sp. SIO3C4]
MDIISILKQDYQKFPADQTYSIYAENVYFEDPLNKFRGIDRYQKMIGFMKNWFNDVQLELHDISQLGDLIKTRWTLSWTAPVPWKPRMAIPGWSELRLNTDGLINSHIDYWDISRLDVLKQLFQVK